MSYLLNKYVVASDVENENALQVRDMFRALQPCDKRQFLLDCLQILGEEHDVEISDAEDSIEELEIIGQYEVTVTVTVDVNVTVNAPDEETASSIVEGLDEIQLINSEAPECEAVDICGYRMDVENVEEL